MRKLYLDNIRWITVVLVVIYHVIFMYNHVEKSLVIGPFQEVQYQDVFLYLVYPWFMLLLFVVSGMSARFYLEKHSNKEFIKSRTVKLLVPSTIGLLVFQWIQGYFSMAINGALESMAMAPAPVKWLIMVLSGQGVLWFAQLLWFFSLILAWIRVIEKDLLYKKCAKTNVVVLLLLAVAIWGSSLILNTPLITVYRCGIYGLGFLIGYFVLSHDEVMERLAKWWAPLSVAAVVLAVIFTIVYWGDNYATDSVLQTPLCNVYAWIAILAILSFMKKWGDRENGFSKWMNQRSWGLYVFHYLVISACAYGLKVYVTDMPVILYYVINLVAAFIGSYVLYAVISRIPVIRWCVLGLSKKKKVKIEEKA